MSEQPDVLALLHCGHGCGLVRPRDDFADDRSRPNGKDLYCRECRAAQRRKKKIGVKREVQA